MCRAGSGFPREPTAVPGVPPGAASFQEMHRHGVAQGVPRTVLDTSSVCIIGEQLLPLALLQGSFAAGEEVRPDVSALSQIAANEFGRVPPQGLLAAESVYRSPNGDPMVLEVHGVDVRMRASPTRSP
jgi:hypothetical protein